MTGQSPGYSCDIRRQHALSGFFWDVKSIKRNVTFISGGIKIIQSKTAPKSNNVLWDDGENLKINRNGNWENIGGSDIPQEKIDSINFGYYTFASSGITANWGPFNIKKERLKQ